MSEVGGRFFQESLDTPEGQAIAYQYLRSRGLQDETIRKYGLGWAPISRKALSEAARSAGYKEEFLIETGLSIKYDDGRLVDRFFDRVIFPIHSVSGRVIAFGGRTLKTDKSVAKYVNSPETEIYVKSKSLYGIYFAKGEISKKNKCILVEGYLDVLSMHQLGITNVVASSGTSLTEDQIRLIHKFTDNITIIYDGDSAGIHAALRGTDMSLKEGMNVKIILLPDGQDPDDFAKKHSLEEVEDYIAGNEQDFISFKTDVLLKEAGNDPLKRAELINDISDTIAVIPDAVVRAMYVRSSAERFDIDERLILDRIGKTRTAMIEAEVKRREREQQKAAQQAVTPDFGPVPDYMDYPEDYIYDDQPGYPEDIPVMAQNPSGIEYPKLATFEKDLLKFILEEGCSTLDFDRDSKYYVEGVKYNVAEFIDGSLAEDDADFFNSKYRTTYEEYFRFYEEGLSQQQIQQRLLNNEDEQIVSVTKELLIEKYQITVKNYENSMTAVSTKLVIYVPKTLLAYQCAKVELLVEELVAELSTCEDAERQMEILQQIGEYNRTRTILNNELGRV